jgi:hypothetical protein
MSLLVAITLTDGFVVAMVYALDDTSDEAITKEIARQPYAPLVASWRLASAEEFPPDRRYRRSWLDDGQRIGIDPPKARAERLAVLRAERNAMLDKLDKEHTRAMGRKQEAEADAIESKREWLRQMPDLVSAALEAATTADELDAVTIP